MTFTGSPFLFLIMIFLLNVISFASATLMDLMTNMYLGGGASYSKLFLPPTPPPQT